MFNGCKTHQKIPEIMSWSNITSIYKKKGSRLSIENDRGIFIQTTLKKILYKLIYVDCYGYIDKNMSDSNIGARRHRNIRDHLFVLYAIINSVIKGGEECIDIQGYDVQKAFDAIWMEECFNDLYNVLPSEKRNDKISLLHKSNLKNLVAVKTPAGLSQRVNMPSIIHQGGIWGSLLCSNTMDTIGRKCKLRGNNIYLYKKRAEVLPLAFVDDLNVIAKCGTDSLKLNIFLNTSIELKKLSFHKADKSGPSKCVRMHVGKSNHSCPSLKVVNEKMGDVKEICYLGDKVSSDGRNNINVKDRTRKGLGLTCQIMKILRSVSLGPYTVEVGLLLWNAILINGM